MNVNGNINVELIREVKVHLNGKEYDLSLEGNSSDLFYDKVVEALGISGQNYVIKFTGGRGDKYRLTQEDKGKLELHHSVFLNMNVNGNINVELINL